MTLTVVLSRSSDKSLSYFIFIGLPILQIREDVDKVFVTLKQTKFYHNRIQGLGLNTNKHQIFQ